MVSAGTSSENGTTVIPSNPNASERNEDGQNRKISEYEQSREERIRENLERMQKLGIFDLSLQVKAHKPTPRARKTPSTRNTPPNSAPLPPSGPTRRSSRLQNVTPVSYSEALLTKKEKPLESEADLLRGEGFKPEFYTEEHEKLLGSTEMEWTLFVDGVGKDGKRIYDPVLGKTCHQCRQKTLGLRTRCCKCNMVQGQFCGDCLYMRYGENVIEANQNPNWICPVCRGICNCSLCRQAKGWPPTGALYRKISNLGYKSVAHFLIQTRRMETETDEASKSKVPVSAKRSLPFTHVEETSREMALMDCSIDHQVSKNPEPQDEYLENLPCDEQEEKTYFLDDGGGKQDEQTNFSSKEQGDCEQEEKTHFIDNEQGKLEMEMMKLECQLNAEYPVHLGSRGKESCILAVKRCDSSNVPGEENVFLNKVGLSISGNDKNGIIQIELKLDGSNHEFSGKKQDVTSYVGNIEIDCPLAPEASPKSNKKRVRTIEAAGDRKGITQIELKFDDSNHEFNSKKQDVTSYVDNNKIDCLLAPELSRKSNKKGVRTIEAAGDSIAGRLRLRRNRDNGQEEEEEHRLTVVENETLVKQDLNGILPQHSAEADTNNPKSSSKATVIDNISKRLRKTNSKSKEQEIDIFSSSPKAETATDTSSSVTAITISKSEDKKIPSSPSPDSIAGRLRQRRILAGGCV